MDVGNAPVAVVTGASSGIGKEVATALAGQGWRVIGTGRDADRIKVAEEEIRAASTGGPVDMISADLSRIAQARKAADAIAARTDRIDLLVNNAGALAGERRITQEGLEANFAGNHLGPFVLTTRLLPLLRAAAKDAPRGSVRILNTSSEAGEMIPSIDLANMRTFENTDPGDIYCAGKLANMLFTRALASRLEADGIVVHAVHPGAVGSNFFAEASAETMEALKNYQMFTPVEGADTLIWLATAEEGRGSSGGYWYQRQPRSPNPIVDHEAYRERFWTATEALVAVALECAAR